MWVASAMNLANLLFFWDFTTAKQQWTGLISSNKECYSGQLSSLRSQINTEHKSGIYMWAKRKKEKRSETLTQLDGLKNITGWPLAHACLMTTDKFSSAICWWWSVISGCAICNCLLFFRAALILALCIFPWDLVSFKKNKIIIKKIKTHTARAGNRQRLQRSDRANERGRRRC